MSEILNLARPEIVALKAYESARSLVSSRSASIYLDANESPFGGSGSIGIPSRSPGSWSSGSASSTGSRPRKS